MKYLLIDADSLLYAAACVSESRGYSVYMPPTNGWVTGEWLGPFDKRKDAIAMIEEAPRGELYSTLRVSNFDDCAARLRASVARIQAHAAARFGDIETSIFISGSANFRERLPRKFPYKGNRVNVEKPQHLHKLREYAMHELGAMPVHFWEPDDEIAMRQTQSPGNVIACSIDKDLKQVAGTHMVPDSGFMEVTPRSALLRLYAQIIGGDSTDGVPGCYRISPEGAAALLREAVSTGDSMAETAQKFWAITMNCYRDSIAKHGTRGGHAKAEDAAIETARFVYLLRDRPSEAAHPYLWKPPI